MTAQLTRAPDAAGVARAHEKIRAILPPTPLLELEIDGATVWCKAECLQPIGAFKIRGAWHRLSDLSEEERAREGTDKGDLAQTYKGRRRNSGGIPSSQRAQAAIGSSIVHGVGLASLVASLGAGAGLGKLQKVLTCVANSKSFIRSASSNAPAQSPVRSL